MTTDPHSFDNWDLESSAWAALQDEEQRMLLEDSIAYMAWLDQIAFIAEQQDGTIGTN